MEAALGAYGKLPSRGDFVRRRLPNAFLGPWDERLQQAISRSREVLAERWLPLYLNAPMWRFVLASQVVGETTAAGVMMPSVDSVYRHFPLTLAALLAPEVNPFAIALEEAWFAGLEELGLACLDAGFAPEGLDARLDALSPPSLCVDAPRPRDAAGEGELSGLVISPDRNAYENLLYPALLDHCVCEKSGAYSLWWTSGSDAVEPSFRVFRGLPDPEAFCTFFADDVAPQSHAVPAQCDDEGCRDVAVNEGTS